MIKKLVLVFLVVLATKSYGQEGMASPYSFYGIGSLKFKGTVENQSMGGISVYMDSIHVNLRNPASYASENLELLNKESRPVKFTVGGSYSSIKLKNNSGSDRASTGTFDYLALSIPLGKFGVGFGLMPYTSVGYKLETLNDSGNPTNWFRGEGGVNKTFLAVGYQAFKGFSIGADVQYNFGNIQNSTIAFNYDDDGVLTLFQSKESNRSDLSGLNVNIGMSYKTMIANKLEFVTALTFTPESKLVSRNERAISVVTIDASTGTEIDVATTDTDLEALGLAKTNLTMPARLSLGTGIGKPHHWFFGIESEFQKTSNFSNELYASSESTYVDAMTFSAGGFYIPEYNSFNNYFKRVVYRAGFHYGNTGLEIKDESIKEFGISFGMGLPIGTFFSNANIGVEVGKRGTLNKNLIQENFVNFQLSLSLNDRWFQKRKYD
ncbi:MAG: hypothetical protein ACK5NB_01060 [Flavobacteriaceae bacterium]